MIKSVFFCLTIILISCTGNSNKAVKNRQVTVANLVTTNNIFHFNCFNSVDTTQQIFARACGNYFYKIIAKKYVLLLKINTPVQYDSCVRISIDTIKSTGVAELIIYKDGEANLFPYCNDVGNTISPIKNLARAFGEIYVKFYKTTEYRGTNYPTASIFVHRLTFIDSDLNSTILISNQLYWKVFQYGEAG
jgi:hypothetical protein